MEQVTEFLEDIAIIVLGLLEELSSLDFWIRYGVIISNFFIIALIVYARRSSRSSTDPSEPKKKILLVTAHPDDEAMFFVPSIMELLRNYHIHLLCFSNGDADGLGKVREQELQNCCSYLKLDSTEIVSHPNIKDGFKENWDRSLLSKYIVEKIEKCEADAVLTFDKNGVSGHPNHKALYAAVQNLISDEDLSKNIKEKGVKFFVNKDVNIVRKYIGVFDFFLCLFDDHIMVSLNAWTSYKAMKIHYSQFVWYRKLFVLFSRYTYINTLKQLN